MHRQTGKNGAPGRDGSGPGVACWEVPGLSDRIGASVRASIWVNADEGEGQTTGPGEALGQGLVDHESDTWGEFTASRPPGASQDAKRRSAAGTLGM